MSLSVVGSIKGPYGRILEKMDLYKEIQNI